MATIEDFAKLDLRIGEIISAEKIPDSDKLLQLEVSFGDEQRQIIAGIGKSYQASDLPGLKACFIFNLEAKTLAGRESAGMILAGSGDQGPVILVPQKDLPAGAKVK